MNLNWEELRKLQAENEWAMLLLATTPLDSDLGQRLQTVFPECYGENTVGPISLAFLDAQAWEALKDESGITPASAATILETSGVLAKYNVPHVIYVFDSGYGQINIPADLDLKSVTAARQTLEWKGKLFFVAEYLQDGMITLIPAECLNMH